MSRRCPGGIIDGDNYYDISDTFRLLKELKQCKDRSPNEKPVPPTEECKIIPEKSNDEELQKEKKDLEKE